MALLTQSGQRVIEGRRLAAGGEGEIFQVVAPPGLAFKRYFRTVLDRNPSHPTASRQWSTSARAVKRRTDRALMLAWPEAAAFDGGQFAGFLMPLIDTANTVELHRVTNPTDRRDATGSTTWLRSFTWRYLIATAANLALATQTVHETDSVIGDFNQRNIRVSRGSPGHAAGL